MTDPYLPPGCSQAAIDRAQSGGWSLHAVTIADALIAADLRQALLMTTLILRARKLIARARALKFETVAPYDSENLDEIIMMLESVSPVTDLAWEARAEEAAWEKSEENRG